MRRRTSRRPDHGGAAICVYVVAGLILWGRCPENSLRWVGPAEEGKPKLATNEEWEATMAEDQRQSPRMPPLQWGVFRPRY